MKKNALLLLSCLLGCACCFAAPRYWVGPTNGNWNNSDNWSETSQGPGGASVPGAADSVIIYNGSVINMDASPTVSSMGFSRSTPGYNNPSQIILYTATGSVLTILKDFSLRDYLGLIDSCSENVPFNIVFNGATGANGFIGGFWRFIGRVPVSTGNGATFTAEPGSSVIVKGFGTITSGSNSAYIIGTPSSLRFSTESSFYIIDNLDAAIPNATFEQDFVEYSSTFPPYVIRTISGSSVSFSGNMGKLTFLNPRPSFNNLYVYLDALTADASLALPNGTGITSLYVNNTNGHTLTLLSGTGDTSGVSVYAGSLYISGEQTKVAMATGTSAAPATNYKIRTRFFTQSGGNFSLQDFNGALGTSSLLVARDITQTGGTFITNSTATDTAAHFVVEMNGPEFMSVSRVLPSVSTGQFINMRSEAIDNGRNKVTLRINNQLGGISGFGQVINLGVTLKSPVTVGRLELLSGTLNTTDTSMITVTDPGATTGIVTSNTGLSFVTGPLRRATNANSPYQFPTGKGVIIQFNGDPIYFHSCSVVPVSTAPSMYQAEYFNAKYSDSTVTVPLKGVSNKEYWNIAKIAGADAQVQLVLNAAVPGATAADAVVVAHYTGNSWISERGTAITPGNAISGTVVSGPLSAFGPFTFGYETAMQDTVITYNCPKDTLIITGAANCKVKVTWAAPNAMFPQTIGIPNGLNSTTAQLNYKGTFNGHGYYQSGDEYHWPDAQSAAAGVGGHLVTITSTDENNFVFTNLNQRNNYAWIGLYNTGTVGSFAWVTGEPLSYTNWIPGQPDNLWNDPTFVDEPYVHINGWADPALCRWNDISGDVQANFIAEFDKAVLTYKQISGPANGDSLTAGTYTICYETANAASGKRDTCCFTITVQCNAITSATASGMGSNDGRHAFSAIAFSNPSSTGFSVKISSDDINQKVALQVTDLSGRMVERKNGIIAGSTVRFGSGYVPGLYFARISQGPKAVIIKLVKQ